MEIPREDACQVAGEAKIGTRQEEEEGLPSVGVSVAAAVVAVVPQHPGGIEGGHDFAVRPAGGGGGASRPGQEKDHAEPAQDQKVD